jgi:RNA polymerase sigma-70 factor, ECF subfamily
MPSPGLQPPLTESALLTQWRRGDQAAARRLLRRQLGPLRGYFARRVPCRADADDLVQRTLIATIDALPRYRHDVDLARFTRAIASKLLLCYRRDGERARARLDADTNPEAMHASLPSAFACICHQHGLQRLRHAIRTLPDDSAQLLRLRYWEERDATEIGQLLGLHPNAVRMRLLRARLEMKRMLAVMGEDEPWVEENP